jgi:iron complex outermembrane receptor protein
MSMLRRVPVAALVPLALSPLAAGIAQAQEQLEEIVVTARLRAESSIEAPAAIKAFTAAEIDSAGIQTPHDYIALTPNMTVVQTQNPGNSFITIRGVSQARNSDMPVSVVVDGVLMTNPAQFNQELYDIQQIEVLKGPQGALYGRNAIGGAVSIVTKAPTDDFEARLRLGADSGPGYMAQGTVSGPLGDAGKWKYRASLSLADTDGFRDNEYLGDKADPYQDTSGRVRFTWEPNDNVTGDFRYARSDIETTALYFVINDDWRTLGSFTGVPNPGQYHRLTVASADVNNVNYTGVPIRVNNAGEGLKDIDEVSMKWDVATDAGTFTSITAYDDLHELLTGDAFDFRPIGQSFNEIFFPRFQNPQQPPLTPNPFFGDWNQAQYLEVSNYSQEFRFTSSEDQAVRWIAGAYLLDTERFIGTGNLLDTGNGVARVYKVPRSTTGFPFDLSIPNPQVTYLSDSQDNFAWAVFGQLAFDLGDEWDMTISARYDEDTREQTTETPPGFIPAVLAGDLVTGQKREETWDAFQPKLTLRWQPNATNTLYGDLSRGFRSGGFNQSGVALAGVAGVFNTFDEQIADTIEVGWKGQFADGRVNTSLAYYTTELSGAYYFIFLVASSTQNLGSLDEVEYDGLEFELDTQLTDALSLNLGIATMNSEVTADAQIPQTVGKEVPLTSDYTFNLGINWQKPLANGREFVVRTDLHSIGDTYWGPGDPAVTPLAWNTTIRDPVNVVDLRVGLNGDDWSATVWAKNVFDEEYNDEFSYPFVWKAMPQRFGIQYTKDF